MSKCTNNERLSRVSCGCEFGGELPAPVERAQRVQLVQDYWRNKERAS